MCFAKQGHESKASHAQQEHHNAHKVDPILGSANMQKIQDTGAIGNAEARHGMGTMSAIIRGGGPVEQSGCRNGRSTGPIDTGRSSSCGPIKAHGSGRVHCGPV